MSFHWHPGEQVRTGRYLLKWTILASLVGMLAGTASAVFLVSLDWATQTRESLPWLVYLLPVAGLLIGLFYHWVGKGIEGGNNLILEEIHKPRGGVPTKLAPAILLATVATHLFGGSAGREGTAVQMGGSLAAWLGRLLRLNHLHVRMLLMAGISAGFGSVFGTPLAGMVFGLEVLAVGRIRFDGLVPCLVASVVGDWTCSAWGVHHTAYDQLVGPLPAVTPWLVGAVLLASLAFALTSLLFGELTHALQRQFKQAIAWAPLRPALGGVLVLVLVWLVGTRDYLGLGVPLIVQSFRPEGVATWAFLWKLIFTAVTLGSGFKGGEVTPLFFMGAALGCTLGHLLGVPPEFLAALGFVAVFAGAANTPLACTIMGIELFGTHYTIFLALACCSSYVWSGHRGIYLSQLLDTPKTDEDHEVPVEATLDHVRQAEPPFPQGWYFLSRMGQGLFGQPAARGKHGENGMKQDRQIRVEKLGVVRIYLHDQDRRPGGGWVQRTFGQPLYQELIAQAREAGLMSAVAKLAPHGFTHQDGAGGAAHPEAGLHNVNLHVELVGQREKLEAFLARVGDLVGNRIILFDEVEHWTAVPAPVSADEVVVP